MDFPLPFEDPFSTTIYLSEFWRIKWDKMQKNALTQKYNLKVSIIEKYSHTYTKRHIHCNIDHKNQKF